MLTQPICIALPLHLITQHYWLQRFSSTITFARSTTPSSVEITACLCRYVSFILSSWFTSSSCSNEPRFHSPRLHVILFTVDERAERFALLLFPFPDCQYQHAACEVSDHSEAKFVWQRRLWWLMPETSQQQQQQQQLIRASEINARHIIPPVLSQKPHRMLSKKMMTSG